MKSWLLGNPCGRLKEFNKRSQAVGFLGTNARSNRAARTVHIAKAATAEDGERFLPGADNQRGAAIDHRRISDGRSCHGNKLGMPGQIGGDGIRLQPREAADLVSGEFDHRYRQRHRGLRPRMGISRRFGGTPIRCLSLKRVQILAARVGCNQVKRVVEAINGRRFGRYRMFCQPGKRFSDLRNVSDDYRLRKKPRAQQEEPGAG